MLKRRVSLLPITMILPQLTAVAVCIAAYSNAFVPVLTLKSTFSTKPRSSDRIRTLSATLHAASKSSDAISDGVKTSSKSKLPHDRTIDRRKSPALWRHDLEYSIDPTGTTKHTDAQANSFLPKAPPELMSPAGGWPQLKAAVANGADAVYLGLTSYSARARAANFDPDPSLLRRHSTNNGEYEPVDGKPASLAHAVKFCHEYNVRVYVAFNTLVFDEELHEVQGLIEQIWDCGVDAVIIQDIGVAKIVKEVVAALSKNGIVGKGLNGAPLEIHASTQQTVTCADGVSFAAERTNATRVVSCYLGVGP
jgi:hypothetical protein